MLRAVLVICVVALLAVIWLWARSRRGGALDARGPKGVPAWAGFWGLEAYRAFTEAVELALVERELEAVHRDGVVAVALPDGRPLQLGLQNLAQRCARLPRHRWAPLIAEHVDRLLGAEGEAGSLDRQDFEAVRSQLKVRLYPAEAVADSDADAVILARPAEGLVAVLVYDLPHTVSSVGAEEAKTWGRDPEELLAVGLENLAAEPPPEREDLELERGVVLRVLSGPSFFVSSHLLRLDGFLPSGLVYGALVSVPTRHLLLLHVIRDSRVLLAINAMIPKAHVAYQQGPGSLVPNLYWWRDGQLVHLPTTVQTDAVKFTPPAAFVKQVMEPMAGQ